MTDLKEITRSFYRQVVNGRDIDAIDEFVVDHFIEHEREEVPSEVPMVRGREGFKALVAAYLAAFDPFHVEVGRQYQDGETVISLVTFHGTHTGPFARVQPTGRSFVVDSIDIFQFKNERMAEHWGKFDRLGMFAQLGVVSPMADVDEPFYGKMLPFG
jgi:predicted ester cyclase